ncbi:hypothetical protein FLONG3_10489 [Fusarium longipes]|uniref:Uncharacterized protein n=1 Tax=Fusarium longipes TaxID=694270 RepID=A0A395RP29_9HYPO|nr:hypothetical protein FLONG3_10489 [Fusarium longipes]
MSRRHSSRSQPVSFLGTLGQWVMGTESSHRSPSHGGRPHRHTDAYRHSRLDHAPPGLNLTARQWREYAEYVPERYCTDEEGKDEGSEEARQPLLPVSQVQPDPLRSAWSHSPSSAVTCAHGTIRRRDSPLDCIIGRTTMQEPSNLQLRDEVSYDANNDPIFANFPRSEERRDVGSVVVHQNRYGDDGVIAESFEQRMDEKVSEDDQRESEASVQPLRESQLFNSPRRAPRIQQAGSDVWPTTQDVSDLPIESSRNRISSWRNTVIKVPEGQYVRDQESSVFGGSRMTAWPGPDHGVNAASVAPDDSVTQIATRRYSRDARGSFESRAGDSHSRSSRTGGSRRSHRRH